MISLVDSIQTRKIHDNQDAAEKMLSPQSWLMLYRHGAVMIHMANFTMSANRTIYGHLWIPYRLYESPTITSNQ